MKISFESPPNIYIQTYGGETWIDNQEFNDYGIQIGDLSISGLTGDDMEKLAIEMVNHLMINGHRFKIEKSEKDQDVPYIFTST